MVVFHSLPHKSNGGTKPAHRSTAPDPPHKLSRDTNRTDDGTNPPASMLNLPDPSKIHMLRRQQVFA